MRVNLYCDEAFGGNGITFRRCVTETQQLRILLARLEGRADREDKSCGQEAGLSCEDESNVCNKVARV